ncbi:MAG TPA: serine/threonine-protein kinase [Candidatus Eisenbacteria bacterium]|nr:serine/threonine-protein kinase [Candidatus Eisenbacteria bacterium]
MTLAAGTRLGRYEIVAPLGAGGMGEVYRARDPRLEREVAIKVLPEALRADADALARFRREARAVAALAHPNLLAIHDVGAEGGFAYAVTELLEGTTLRQRIVPGGLPVAQALELARPLALGLAAAHDKGIVHRDLKPENVFVTRDGHVKVLDFGLAKRTMPDDAAASALATASLATAPGMVVGTIGYMAPEQLRAEPAGPAADVFAWGVIAYELLAGHRPFAGATWAEAAASVLHADPAPLAGRDVPAALDAVVMRCLAKDPAARFADGRALVTALNEMPSASAAWVASAGAAAPAPRANAIAMLAFDNLTGDAALDWMTRGIPELLGTALARSPELDVYDAQRLGDLSPAEGAARDSASGLQRVRGAGIARALVGSIVRAGAGLRVQCRVLEAGSGRVLHADAAAATSTDDVFELAAGLVPKLQTWLEIDLAAGNRADQWLRQITTTSSDAYRLYLRGHEAFLASRWREAADFHEQSLALDPGFVAARVDLTGCYWNLGDEQNTRDSLVASRRLLERASPREQLAIEMLEAVIALDSPRLIRAAFALHALYPERRFFTYLLARGYYTGSQWERCLATLAPLIAERWTWAWSYVLASRAHAQLGRADEARRTLELGMQVTHGEPELALEYARFLQQHGDERAARQVLTTALHSSQLPETPECETAIRSELAKYDER